MVMDPFRLYCVDQPGRPGVELAAVVEPEGVQAQPAVAHLGEHRAGSTGASEVRWALVIWCVTPFPCFLTQVSHDWTKCQTDCMFGFHPTYFTIARLEK